MARQLYPAQIWCDKWGIAPLDRPAWNEANLSWDTPITELTFVKLIMDCPWRAKSPVLAEQFLKHCRACMVDGRIDNRAILPPGWGGAIVTDPPPPKRKPMMGNPLSRPLVAPKPGFRFGRR